MGMALHVPLYTVDDLENFPDDGNRYELLNGVLSVTPAPGSPHQGVSMLLSLMLGNALMTPGFANVYAPGVMIRPPDTSIEPDILVVPSRFAIGAPWVEMTEHWIAVEVFSRSSRKRDREVKRDEYFRLGVCEVWLVDPRKKCVEVSRQPGKFEVVRDVLTLNIPEVPITVTINLNDVFAGLP
ncbi:MAG: Uma2 family endonuclease [Gemmatimonadaceae bacterium]